MKDEYQTNSATNKLQMQMSLDMIRETLPETLAYQVELSKLVFNYYLTLIQSGFSEEQALDIVKVHGWKPPGN